MSTAATFPPARGFGVDRADGRAALPGSMHTNRRLAQWLSLAQPGAVQVCTGKVELGQGILTALRLIAAEELDVAIDRVQVLPATTLRGPDEGVTSGSLSVQDSGGALRQACAELRALAARAALQRAGASDLALAVRDGVFFAPDGRALGDYWELLAGVDLGVECTGEARPKPMTERRLLGRADVLRVDLADKVYGKPRFIHDLRLPGLLHGRVLRPPSPGARLAAWPPVGLAPAPAGVQCWADGSFVAVVAQRERDAESWAERVRARLVWQPGPALPDPHTLVDFLSMAPHERTVPVQRSEGQAGAAPPDPEAWPVDGQRFEAEFFKPYLAHASIGPSCAIARWNGARLEVWTHSQAIQNLRDDLVLALAREAEPVAREHIAVHHLEGAGCYGHNGADDVALDAVLMALRCPGRPVRVRWSRADELTHSPFGPAQRVRLQARVDPQGRLTHWRHAHWSNGYSSRPGRAKTPALLAASEREQATPLPLPVNPPLAGGGGAARNAAPGYTLPCLQVVEHRLTVAPLRTSAMRALGAYANVFAIESFVDEIAQALGEDALAFRRRHLDDARALAVLDAVVERSGWWARRVGEPDGTGRGLGWARYKNTGAWCAAIARVEVGEAVRVTHLDLAVDVGTVVDLDGVINQIEGGAVQATSWTLKEQVAFGPDGVTSTGWDSYPVLRFTEVPEVRVHVLDRPDQPSLGAGEAAQGPVAAAIANAVHNALGVRVRTLPLNPDHLLRAVHAAEGA